MFDIKEKSRIWSDDAKTTASVFGASFAFFWLCYIVSAFIMKTLCKSNKIY